MKEEILAIIVIGEINFLFAHQIRVINVYVWNINIIIYY